MHRQNHQIATLAGHLGLTFSLWINQSKIFISSQSLRDFAAGICFLNQRLTHFSVRHAWLWRPATGASLSAKWG
jgi:hypothetical protein